MSEPAPFDTSALVAAASAEFLRAGRRLPRDMQNLDEKELRKLIFDGKRMRKPVVRKTVDFNSTIIKHLQTRLWQRDSRDRFYGQGTLDYIKDMEPMWTYEHNPSHAYLTKYVSVAINKNRCPINCVVWTPEGRRLITGNHRGEFTLWNGLTFNFETILQAHDGPVRAMTWSHNDMWLASADDTGVIKYWQSSMNNVKAFKGHKDIIRDLTFCPTDVKFASCSDDQSISIWDFERCQEDIGLKGGEKGGHGWDVKSVHWHPYKALLLSGSKDSQIKLWDPKSGSCLTTLHGHKNTVSRVRWNNNGRWFLSGSRDQLIKVWDIRTMKPLQTLRGHQREITALSWHPWFEELFVSGSYDGSIQYWIVTDSESQAEICGAHEHSVWDLSWHPLGHIMVSGSNDHTTRFWTRNRPGDEMKDKYNANQLPEEDKYEAMVALAEAARNAPNRYGKTPAILEGFQLPPDINIEEETEEEAIPGFGAYDAKMKEKDNKQTTPGTKPQTPHTTEPSTLLAPLPALQPPPEPSQPILGGALLSQTPRPPIHTPLPLPTPPFYQNRGNGPLLTSPAQNLPRGEGQNGRERGYGMKRERDRDGDGRYPRDVRGRRNDPGPGLLGPFRGGGPDGLPPGSSDRDMMGRPLRNYRGGDRDRDRYRDRRPYPRERGGPGGGPGGGSGGGGPAGGGSPAPLPGQGGLPGGPPASSQQPIGRGGGSVGGYGLPGFGGTGPGGGGGGPSPFNGQQPILQQQQIMKNENVPLLPMPSSMNK